MNDILKYLKESKYITENHIENLRVESEKLNLDPDRQIRETDNSRIMEGLYIKVEENGIVVDRMKYVRYSFLQTVEESQTHWLDRPIIPNKLDKDINYQDIDYLKEAKGYFGSKHRLYKTAHEQVMHSGQYAFRDRRQNKRNFRKLWIARINAACRENEISYSKFINGLTKAGVTVNRKMLSELAIDNREAFADLVTIAKDALAGKAYTPKEVAVAAKEEVATEKKTTTKKATTAKKTTKKEEK